MLLIRSNQLEYIVYLQRERSGPYVVYENGTIEYRFGSFAITIYTGDIRTVGIDHWGDATPCTNHDLSLAISRKDKFNCPNLIRLRSNG